MLKDFPDLLLKYMLGFLLFAASIEVDLRNLGRILSTVIALALVSTLLSTFIVAIFTYFLMLNIAPMEFRWCLLFGAVVSPTDPITVVSILNDKPDLLPASTKYFLVSESLLNDGVGVVLYLVMLSLVKEPDLGPAGILNHIFEIVIVECVYGAAIGTFLAWIAYSAIGSVKEPLLEVAITFVLVGNINMICRIVGASIPLASVAAGLFIGNYAVTFAMNEEATETFHEMWKLADETLNSVLFLMVGSADVFWKPQQLGWSRVLALVVCTISISIVTRFIAVALPLLTIIFIEWVTGRRLRHLSVRYRGGIIAVLTWAGMRGGISIALALGVPDSFVSHAVPGHMTYGQLIFFMTFILVAFSLVIQGLLFEPVVKMINRVSFDIFTTGGLGTYGSSTSLGIGNNDSVYEDEVSPDGSFIGEGQCWIAGGHQLYEDYPGDTSGTGTSVGPEVVQPGTQSVPVYDGTGEDKVSMSDCMTTRGTLSEMAGGTRGGLQPSNYATRPPRPARLVPGSHSGYDLPRGTSEHSFPRTRDSDMQMYGSTSALPPDVRMGPGGVPLDSGAHEHTRQGSLTFQNLPQLKQPPSMTTIFDDLRRGASKLPRLFDKSGAAGGSGSGGRGESHPLRRSRTEPDNVRLARGDRVVPEVDPSELQRRINLGPTDGALSVGPVDGNHMPVDNAGDSSDGGFTSGTQSAGEGGPTDA